MQRKRKGKHHISFTPGRQMEFKPERESDVAELTEEQKTILKQVRATMVAYIKAGEKLLNGQYAQVKAFAPKHFQDIGNVFVGCCPDGIVVRYEKKTGTTRGLAFGWYENTLSDLVPMVSESVVFCIPEDNSYSLDPNSGLDVELFKDDMKTGQRTTIEKYRLRYCIKTTTPKEELPVPPNKPYCLLSIENALEVSFLGELIAEENPKADGKRFIATGQLALPVGWECIEVYPYFNISNWKPEFAEIWAENDILKGVMRRQTRKQQLNDIDPNVRLRKEHENLLTKYKALLDSKPEKEEILQVFLKENPVLLSPTHIQVKPKVKIKDKITDFVIQEASGEYVLVEI